MNTSSDITLDNVRQKINEKINKNIKIFEPSVLSVYRQKINSREKPEQVGTAFIVKYKNVQYLITAYHVFQQASNEGAPVFLSKGGKFFDLEQIKDESVDEVFDEDLDFYTIKTKNSPAGIDGISIEEQSPQTQYELCLTIGYPNSRNKTRIDVKNITAKSTCLRLALSNRKPSGEVMPVEANFPYFLMEWSKKSLDTDWNKVDAIGVRGMSGAPCFNIPFRQEDITCDVDPYIGVGLVGLLVEMDNEAIKFLKFSEIISCFQQSSDTGSN